MKLKRSALQLESLVDRIDNDEVDLQPDFQRGEVWDKRRQQRLIDTILRAWYVPAVHLIEDGRGNESVLDGQQRIKTIYDFFRDRIVIDGKSEPADDAILSLDGKRYSELPPQVRRQVQRFTLDIISLYDFEPSEPNELFFRLNQSYNLTPAEKRNALYGPTRDQVRSLVDQLRATGLLEKSAIGFSNGRLAYDDIIARTCVAIELNTLTTHINNNTVELFYRENTEGFSSTTLSSLVASSSILLQQIHSSEQSIRFNKGTLQTWLLYCFWAPVETGPIPVNLLSTLESLRLGLRGNSIPPESAPHSAVQAILRLYDDRSSYRVTDVSSVVARDGCIHLLSNFLFKTTNHLGSADFCDFLEKDLDSANENVVMEFLSRVNWGSTLLTKSGIIER